MSTRFSLLEALVRFSIERKLVVFLIAGVLALLGALVAPFDWELGSLPRDPIAVDAIPDIGENQQIVFTEWPGRSPQDIDDQVSYPLTVALLGVPEVKSVRSSSIFGFSTVYVIFEDGVDFYWSRSRILEKLASLPPGSLPEGVSPALGPDATGLGQVFWYTLEGRDEEGNPTGGWDLDELRTIQDWTVRYKLMSVEGVAEVASVGGFVREYQVNVDPDALRAFGVTLEDVVRAVRGGNIDVGARTLEVNRAEYIVRGLGNIESLGDIEKLAVRAREGVPVFVEDVADVRLGPALRRGVLDKGGAEAVGGVVVARYGANPKAVIDSVKDRVADIASALPSKILPDGRLSTVTLVPFYDRSGLIGETIGTLGSALWQQVLVTVLVVLVMVLHLRGSLLISTLLPLSVLLTFVLMKLFRVEANIVALSGIAIAVGTIVDMGIVLVENILRRLESAGEGANVAEQIVTATREVGGAVMTAVLTTVVSFLPVFTMQAAEGKLFKPLAYTKTFALLASILFALFLLPPIAHLVLGSRASGTSLAARVRGRIADLVPGARRVLGAGRWVITLLAALAAFVVLTRAWLPLGPGRGLLLNLLFVALLVGGTLAVFLVFHALYPRLLAWGLRNKLAMLSAPLALVAVGGMVWLGAPFASLERSFPGLGREFMPSLDEGSFLYMPTTMPHASLEESVDVLQKLDMAIVSVPEVESAVGKLGRVESALDPAPISMIETVVNYKPEYSLDDEGQLRRNWRDHIRSPADIWDEIVAAANLPGTTSAPRLQPIEARLVMLQSGFRANMGVKVYGPSLEAIESFGLDLESTLKAVPELEPAAVFADRVVGKPYIEIDVDRERIARYGISVEEFQDVVEVAIGGKRLSTTIEGRERYPISVRYQRERRDSIEALGEILVRRPEGGQVPLRELAEIRYVRGPQMIRSEDTFLVSYVIFDAKEGVAELAAVEAARAAIEDAIAAGAITVPEGVSYRIAGAYENQVRASRTLALVLPLALVVIVLLLYLHFRALSTTLMVFSGVLVAWAGGFVFIWLYGQPWFLDVSVLGQDLRELFQVKPINLSVAVWVGFLALFGIATDDGVVMATRLKQVFSERAPRTIEEIRAATLEAGRLRVRACLMTSATTILALLPVLTSTGRGSDVMVPMAIPAFGGMCVALLSLFVVPLLFAALQEWRVRLAALMTPAERASS